MTQPDAIRDVVTAIRSNIVRELGKTLINSSRDIKVYAERICDTTSDMRTGDHIRYVLQVVERGKYATVDKWEQTVWSATSDSPRDIMRGQNIATCLMLLAGGSDD